MLLRGGVERPVEDNPVLAPWKENRPWSADPIISCCSVVMSSNNRSHRNGCDRYGSYDPIKYGYL